MQEGHRGTIPHPGQKSQKDVPHGPASATRIALWLLVGPKSYVVTHAQNVARRVSLATANKVPIPVAPDRNRRFRHTPRSERDCALESRIARGRPCACGRNAPVIRG